LLGHFRSHCSTLSSWISYKQNHPVPTSL